MTSEEEHTLLGYLLQLPAHKLEELAADEQLDAEVRNLASRLTGGEAWALLMAFLDGGRG